MLAYFAITASTAVRSLHGPGGNTERDVPLGGITECDRGREAIDQLCRAADLLPYETPVHSLRHDDEPTNRPYHQEDL